MKRDENAIINVRQDGMYLMKCVTSNMIALTYFVKHVTRQRVEAQPLIFLT